MEALRPFQDEAKNLIDELQRSAVLTKTNLEDAATNIKEATGEQEKVKLTAERKLLLKRQQLILKALLRVRERYDEVLMEWEESWEESTTAKVEETDTERDATRPEKLSREDLNLNLQLAKKWLSDFRQKCTDGDLIKPSTSNSAEVRSKMLAEERDFILKEGAWGDGRQTPLKEGAWGEGGQTPGSGGKDDSEGAGPLAIAEPVKLFRVIERLHNIECTLQFQTKLLVDTKTTSAHSDYSHGNFAYGSTPYRSWTTVFQESVVQEEVREAIRTGKKLQVWGSSIGWIPLYAALTFQGLKTTGYELLPCLHQVAEQVVMDEAIHNAEFKFCDMMDAPASEAQIVMLTSQCWDDQLMHRVGDKLANELPMDSIVIDYTNKLKDWVEFGHEPVATVTAPVSWNPTQTFYIWKKRAPCHEVLSIFLTQPCNFFSSFVPACEIV
ncbi:hypothetical protein CYMTET_55450 [Cymbomonas tetramitiformis]|uniref:Uncharacterized protein n=1 Tax=Cymbomonas tetramitiformis TaxID=36881 RepID=A0AAE0BEQ0_9CHLO|nr:hypothetical protein CYMTET_55450 [Cymbomonas tetramitiformis]